MAFNGTEGSKSGSGPCLKDAAAAAAAGTDSRQQTDGLAWRRDKADTELSASSQSLYTANTCMSVCHSPILLLVLIATRFITSGVINIVIAQCPGTGSAGTL